ncbi:Epsin-1 [Serendipita indica DSM 11827]|nr:Epsin-1 [Serendipita indica DSM 11827]
MSIQSIGKGALRVAKNYTKGYSDVQAKVRDATSNDPWGPSGTQMNEIAQLTYNQNDFVEIMEMLDKRLNDKGKNWRHVFKALTLLDYCLHAGSENVVIYFRDNVYLVKTLKEFQYIDEFGKDQGANVRQKAKDITNLLQDEARLRQERRSRASMRDRMTRGGDVGADDQPDENVARKRQQSQPASSSRRNRDDEELKRAMEASKQSYAQEVGKSAEQTHRDADLERALKLSEQEERDRAKAVEDANSRALFDDSLQTAPAAQAQSNPFPLVDASLQPQYTQMQPQFTSFNPYLQEQQQSMMQAQWAQANADWQAQQFALQQQQLQQQQQQQQQEYALYVQQQNELAFQQQQQQAAMQNAWIQQQATAQPLIAQPTGFGSRNPFALGPGPGASPAPPVPTLSPPPQTQPNFTSLNGHAGLSQSQAPAPSPSPSSSSQPGLNVRTRQDENPALAALFANRDGGIDTFGNYGNLRFGNTNAGKMLMANTGTGNPYGTQAQTGNDQPFFSV